MAISVVSVVCNQYLTVGLVKAIAVVSVICNQYLSVGLA